MCIVNNTKNGVNMSVTFLHSRYQLSKRASRASSQDAAGIITRKESGVAKIIAGGENLGSLLHVSRRSCRHVTSCCARAHKVHGAESC